MIQSDLSTTSVVAWRDGILHAEVDQEVVALCVDTGMCYGLNGVGSRVWALLATPVQVGDVCKTLASEYDVDPGQCEREVIDLLKEALAEGMIKVDAGDGEAIVAVEGANP